MPILQGLERGLLIPHSRSFFTRFPHPAQFFFPRKIHLKVVFSRKADKCKMWIGPFDWYFEFTSVKPAFKGSCKKKKKLFVSPLDKKHDMTIAISEFSPRPLLLLISANPVKVFKCFTMKNRWLGSSPLSRTLNFSLCMGCWGILSDSFS